MSRAVRMTGLALGFAAFTAVAGWWSVAVLGAVWSRLARGTARESGIEASLGAGAGWAVLLGWDAAHGPAATLAQRVGGVFLLPGWGFMVVTLGFGALLAAAAALAAAPSKRARERSPEATSPAEA